ncbi:tRNA (adenosine(37)-N6)-threonylcarbamoyltransferase complex dimerization subunit type 1 TsaB [Eoetvoesiella caeni]
MDLHILALETSSSLCGVALLSAGEGRLHVRTLGHDATAEHAERLLPMVDQLLKEAAVERRQLSAIAFGQGPGGFTGLRVACGVAQGMAFALGLPVIPVPSLLAVAEQEPGGNAVCVVLQDARMNELYAAAYRQPTVDGVPTWQAVREPVLLNVHDAHLWLEQLGWQLQAELGPAQVNIKLLGDALGVYPILSTLAVPAHGAAPARISWGQAQRATAEAVARIAQQAWQRGETVAPDQAAPLYVRDKVAYTVAERDQGLGGNPKAQAPVAIVRMRMEDLPVVANIEARVQAFPWTLGNFRDALEAGYGAWVARQGEQILGFSLVMFAPDIAHLLLIAVTPEAQRTGVGYMLLRHCEHETAKRDLPALMLEVRPTNEQAVSFYRNRGFMHTGTRKGYYPKGGNEREDGWVMEKTLKTAKAPA